MHSPKPFHRLASAYQIPWCLRNFRLTNLEYTTLNIINWSDSYMPIIWHVLLFWAIIVASNKTNNHRIIIDKLFCSNIFTRNSFSSIEFCGFLILQYQHRFKFDAGNDEFSIGFSNITNINMIFRSSIENGYLIWNWNQWRDLWNSVAMDSRSLFRK